MSRRRTMLLAGAVSDVDGQFSLSLPRTVYEPDHGQELQLRVWEQRTWIGADGELFLACGRPYYTSLLDGSKLARNYDLGTTPGHAGLKMTCSKRQHLHSSAALARDA